MIQKHTHFQCIIDQPKTFFISPYLLFCGLTYRTMKFRAAFNLRNVTGVVIGAVNIGWPVTHRALGILISAVKMSVPIWT